MPLTLSNVSEVQSRPIFSEEIFGSSVGLSGKKDLEERKEKHQRVESKVGYTPCLGREESLQALQFEWSRRVPLGLSKGESEIFAQPPIILQCRNRNLPYNLGMSSLFLHLDESAHMPPPEFSEKISTKNEALYMVLTTSVFSIGTSSSLPTREGVSFMQNPSIKHLSIYPPFILENTFPHDLVLHFSQLLPQQPEKSCNSFLKFNKLL